MMRRFAIIVFLFVIAAFSTCRAASFDTPQDTFTGWLNQFAANQEWHLLLPFYESKFCEEMKKQAIESDRVRTYYTILDEYIGNRKFVPDKVDITGDKAVMIAKSPDGKTMTFEFLKEEGEWKISKLPEIPASSVLSAKSLIIVAFVLLALVIFLAKKVFLA